MTTRTDFIEEVESYRPEAGISIWSLGGPSVIVQTPETLVYLDLFTGPSPEATLHKATEDLLDPQSISRVDAALCTHHDLDHCHRDSLAPIHENTGALFIEIEKVDDNKYRLVLSVLEGNNEYSYLRKIKEITNPLRADLIRYPDFDPEGFITSIKGLSWNYGPPNSAPEQTMPVVVAPDNDVNMSAVFLLVYSLARNTDCNVLFADHTPGKNIMRHIEVNSRRLKIKKHVK